MRKSAWLVRWLVGVFVGTLLMATTSPLFLRNYPPRMFCEERQAVVFAPDVVYRWRREGYATTRFGPMGTVGSSSRSDVPEVRVALWGDSQAEGVCVSDEEKIAYQTERLTEEFAGRDTDVSVLCFARSGDHSNHWISQIASLARHDVNFDVHAFLVTQSEDWCIEAETPAERLSTMEAFTAEHVPAFLIEAVRNTLTVDGSGSPRRLRWTLGPVEMSTLTEASGVRNVRDEKQRTKRRLFSQVDRLHRTIAADDRVPRLLFLYAPLSPSITGGQLLEKPESDWFYEALREAAQRTNAEVIDLTEAMQDSVDQGQWPRGFHHGRFGSGHYNAVGNRIIAGRLAEWILQEQSK
ncbi:MAG: SGNH/GDSL hydrolase family protein [Planctomycetota bacterium]